MPSQIISKPTSIPPTQTTTTEFFIPEIIVNKLAKTSNGYDYNRPTRPPHNTYIPPSFDDFKPIDTPVQQFPDTDQQFEIPSESDFGFSPPSNNNNVSSLIPQGYLPSLLNRAKFKNFDNGNVIITYDKNQFAGYDYNVPTHQPPIIIPKPIEGTNTPLGDENISGSDTDKHPFQGYHYEEPISSNISSTSSPEILDEPHNGYLPPVPSDISIRHSKDLAKFTTNNPIKLQLKEMRCLNNQNGFFRAILKLDSGIGLIPIVDSGILDSKCELKLTQSHIVVNISVEDFLRCGIRDCGKHLCLRIRFPLIPEIKTASDSILTLQCKLQEKIITKTHTLKMDVANNVQGRSVGTLAHGGIQQPFQTKIDILRKSSNGFFTRRLEPHGSVHLGEELLIRTHINTGDGWNYTKLTDVNLQRISSSGQILNSANLITSNGCINPVMRPICPIQPSFDPPLGHRLSFKAVMFQGMQSGEEIVMSLKITGCMERADCYINTQYCSSSFSRFKRNSNGSETFKNNSSEFEEISKISFRVIIPEDDNDQKFFNFSNSNTNSRQYNMMYLIGGGIGMVCFLSFLIVFIFLKLKQKLHI